jgi:hypothetical protein
MVESLNLQLKHGFHKEVAKKPGPTIKLFLTSTGFGEDSLLLV